MGVSLERKLVETKKPSLKRPELGGIGLGFKSLRPSYQKLFQFEQHRTASDIPILSYKPKPKPKPEPKQTPEPLDPGPGTHTQLTSFGMFIAQHSTALLQSVA